MNILKWVGTFIFYWFLGTMFVFLIQMIGIDLGSEGPGLIIFIVIVIGLILYGVKQTKGVSKE